ncbi:guanylate kinase [Mycoplasma nasistruthionis]|uniref:Guanylate kinase n=1 Tax=Mycoplasma nasistruthionis TaxID=353852 RepID=A0A4Y6I5Z2_9MOLU|nr:guanylate kinase [Mycoplasma nasistruthionis]QCZ36761.1 guanylate kinase [Mycoplasma nasistruthionis]QDF65044.1 guanylate kinase [Mycoplasma nasistruthionis]
MNKDVKKLPIIIFTGPSGVGKGTVERLLFNFEELNLSLSCSATTRAPRDGELNGVHYYFIDTDLFRNKIKSRKFIEFSFHFENYYGTLYSELDKIYKKKKVPLLEIETFGATTIMKKFANPDSKESEKYNLITIFLAPPTTDDLRKRILNRGSENSVTLERRLKKAEEELEQKDKFKYVVINDVPEKAANRIRKILHKELGLDH